MPKKTVREMTELERKHYSLSARVFHASIMGAMILGFVAFCVGISLYTWSLVRQDIDMAFNLTRSAESILSKVAVREPLVEEVISAWTEMSPEERENMESDYYRERFAHVQERTDWQTILSVLNDFMDSSDVNDIYLAMYMREQSALVYIADPDPSGFHFDPGEWETVEEAEIEKFLTWDGSGKLYDISKTEKYGWMCTAGVPVRNSRGEAIAFVLADVTLTDIADGLKDFLYQYSAAMLLATILIGVLMTKHMKKTLVDPINDIADAAQAYVKAKREGVQTTDCFSMLNIRTGDEIENLSLVMADMEKELGEYIEHLTAVTAEKERIGTELDLARRIQRDMLPNIFPPFPDRTDFDVYATMNPAKEVGGDFYDYFLIDKDNVALVIADVSGKGIPAALFMMIAKILVQNYAMSCSTPAEVLKIVNDQICRQNQEEMFVTVWLGVLNLKTGIITASNAGHEYPILMKPTGDFEVLKDKHGFVVGGMEESNYSNYTVRLEPGSKLFLYTDGVPEATNNQNEMFGTALLLQTLNRVKDKSPQDILKAVDREVKDFVGKGPQFDDLTMLCVEYTGPGMEGKDQ